VQESYAFKNDEMKYRKSYRKQLKDILSNQELKELYIFISKSEKVRIKDIKNNLNIKNIENKLKKLQDAHLIRKGIIKTSTGITETYEKDIILPGCDDIICEYI
jgi:hypothetical protein